MCKIDAYDGIIHWSFSQRFVTSLPFITTKNISIYKGYSPWKQLKANVLCSDRGFHEIKAFKYVCIFP